MSITRPELLAKELFTHRGSGTLVRMGEKIRTCRSWDEIDLEQLTDLLETSFGKRLVPGYFEKTPLSVAYISESYRAAALITKDQPLACLDKFAVTEKAQGEGLGRAVWDCVRENHASLYWRARPENAVNQFYFRQADGFVRQDKWLVFWYGVDSFASVGDLVAKAAGAEATLR